MAKHRNQVGLALVGWGFSSLFINVFLQVNAMADGNKLYLLAFGLPLIAWLSLIGPWWVRLGSGLAAGITAWWWLVPLNASWPAPKWFAVATARLWQQGQSFIQAGQVDMASDLSKALALGFLICIAYMVLLPHLPMIVGSLLALYLAAVHVFNDTELTLQFGALIVLLLATRLSWQFTWRKLVVFGLCAALVCGLTRYSHNNTITNLTLMNWTMGIRSWVNASGFYQRIDAYVNGPARTGYSQDDTTLGGPLHDDPTPVMRVSATTPQYMRAQFKSVYSGKGWQNASGRSRDADIIAQSPLVDPDATTLVPAKPQTVIIRPTKALTVATIPYGRLVFQKPKARPYYSVSTGAVMLAIRNVNTWQLAVTPQKPSAAQQRAVRTLPLTTPTQIQNVQLPDTLPKRVRTLAAKLTRDQTTQYDRVKAIEHYLATNADLTYSKSDTPHTPKGRDYVDYFLFDSHIGYCDNFSSAMVVMLRSLNIPARWAKGFAPGTVSGTTNGRQTYTITNSDAHSWPEVYFGQYGWLQFEPTPGFGNTPVAATSAAASSSTATTSSRRASTSSASSATATTRVAASPSSTATTPWQLVLIACLIGLISLLSPRLFLLGLFARRTQTPTS